METQRRKWQITKRNIISIGSSEPIFPHIKWLSKKKTLTSVRNLAAPDSCGSRSGFRPKIGDAQANNKFQDVSFIIHRHCHTTPSFPPAGCIDEIVCHLFWRQTTLSRISVSHEFLYRFSPIRHLSGLNFLRKMHCTFHIVWWAR